jgi:thiamine-phosphate pyrophosphorylase
MAAMTSLGDDRRARLAQARLYLVCDARGDGGGDLAAFLDAALRGGADVVQLREKDGDDATILRAAADFRAACDAHGALFVLNDRPDLVAATGADGVHVGQDDLGPAQARALVGPDALIGRSTHTPAQLDAADADAHVDYFAVGPVHATPTKPGRPAVGLELIAHAASRPRRAPWFAIGGIAPDTIAPVVAAGARRVVVVRALTQAEHPEATARALRGALAQEDAPGTKRPRRSSEERNAELRAQLEPLAAGQRPGAVTVAAVVAVALAALVVVGYATGAHLGGRATLPGTLVLAGICLAAAAGMWRGRYGAVLGFEALLAFQIIVAALSLLVASNVWAVVLCLAVLGFGGWLFWKLIRAMARIQMRERRAGQ